jgi:hypothetical protein
MQKGKKKTMFSMYYLEIVKHQNKNLHGLDKKLRSFLACKRSIIKLHHKCDETRGGIFQ